MKTAEDCWWKDDRNVTPCPACGCPLQAVDGRGISAALRAHYARVHPGVRPELVVAR